MNILAFDTCFQTCSVAAGFADKNGEQIGPTAYHFERRDKGHAEVLVPLIADVLRDAGLHPSNIDLIVTTRGPGSFTGTRTAVAAARGFSLATGAPIETTTSLRAISYSVRRKITDNSVCKDSESTAMASFAVTIDARRGGVYALANPDGGLLGVDEDVALLSYVQAVGLADRDDFCFAGSGAELVCSTARELGQNAVAILPDLQPDARDLWCMAAARKCHKVDKLEPLYLRPADAKPQTSKIIARA